MSDTLEKLQDALYNGDADVVGELTEQALDEGLSAEHVLNGGLVSGMNRVGNDFREGELFVPEVLIAARAMRSGMKVLRPLLAEGDVSSAGTVVIGTVTGDLHDIGKNLVGMMLEGGGFDVVDLGTDSTPEAFVDAIREKDADIIGMSALLTTTMPAMKETVDALVSAGLRDRVKVMIGGAPVTQAFADEIGADGYAPDAASAVDLARSLVG